MSINLYIKYSTLTIRLDYWVNNNLTALILLAISMHRKIIKTSLLKHHTVFFASIKICHPWLSLI
ncbi:hypothetical protein A1OE_1359 [Candidatus Endolissoclinum faulkneri L2]|uniref:Uncharacterized protein n=1 Tax=Candidatus Endolissoclinum faulkneri L2 TaxID=1193729 RepID=K7ZDH7_9PROT|nr:hypothetical protein A1OE_1359 [Candidatus Endolissoclinum faulkneri L2]